MLLLCLLASTIVGPGEVESLTAASDAVVHAEVVSRSSAWGAGGGQIFTTVVLRALSTWKGEQADQITLLVPGGEMGDLSQTVSGMAVFGEGEEVVVFVRRRAPGVFALQSMALGKFSVGAANPSLPKRALRDRRGLECVGCAAGDDDLSLDELRARVLRSARK